MDLAPVARARTHGDTSYIALNAAPERARFVLPRHAREQWWERLLDTTQRAWRRLDRLRDNSIRVGRSIGRGVPIDPAGRGLRHVMTDLLVTYVDRRLLTDGMGNLGAAEAILFPMRDRPHALTVALPPLAVVALKASRGAAPVP